MGDARPEAGEGIAAPRPTARPLVPAVVLALAVGFVAVRLLLWLTSVAERSDIGGNGWSLSDNGALIVPWLGLPAVLVGGWVALAAWFAREPGWWAAGLAAGLAVVVLPVAGLLALSDVGVVAALLVCLLIIARTLVAAVRAGAGGRLAAACLALLVGAFAGIAPLG
jgi:hypothetical protein